MLGSQHKNNPTDHLVQWMKNNIKLTLMVGMLVVIGAFINPINIYAHHDDNDLIKTIYHVYLDGEKVGTVHHKSDVESYIENRLSSVEGKTEQEVTFNEKIEYKEESVFQPRYSLQNVIEVLEKELSLAVEATLISVDGQAVGYVQNEEVANTLLNQLKLEYVSEETLAQLEARKSEMEDATTNTETNSDLDSGVLDVTFSQNVTVTTSSASPDKIMKPEDIITLLKKGTLEEKIHIVQSGDVLGTIAEEYDLSYEEILELNPNLTKDSLIKIGDEIVVTDFEPYIKVIVKEVVTQEEKIAFVTEYKNSDDLFKGVSKTAQEGQNGLKKVKYSLVKENGSIIKREVINTKVIDEPVSEIIIKGTKVIPSRGTGSFAWPTIGGYVSSGIGYRWGSYHKGIDIARPSNRAILAADNGTVVSAGWDSGGYGNRIVINHNNGYRTTYSHLSSIKVRPGQVVQRGQQIGVMGSTGNSTGIHLHFEVFLNGSLQNPAKFY